MGAGGGGGGLGEIFYFLFGKGATIEGIQFPYTVL